MMPTPPSPRPAKQSRRRRATSPPHRPPARGPCLSRRIPAATRIAWRLCGQHDVIRPPSGHWRRKGTRLDLRRQRADRIGVDEHDRRAHQKRPEHLKNPESWGLGLQQSLHVVYDSTGGLATHLRIASYQQSLVYMAGGRVAMGAAHPKSGRRNCASHRSARPSCACRRGRGGRPPAPAATRRAALSARSASPAG